MPFSCNNRTSIRNKAFSALKYQLPKKHTAFALALMVIAGVVTSIQAQTPTEYEVKAAFLYNFSRFIEWTQAGPAHSETPFVIGIVGENPFEDALEKIVAGKSVNGQKLAIRQLRKADEGKTCQIVFISSSEGKRFRQVLETLKGSAVLTVGEVQGFAESGGMINFTVVDSSVHFEINVNAASDAGLQISSKLLNLATIVKTKAPGGKN